jgi:tRNA G10  N-methylase Trm11
MKPRFHRILADQSAAKGELVIDPFTGSGSAGAAAVSMGCNFAGTDVTAAAVELARSRISLAASEVDRFEDLLTGDVQLGLMV